MPELKLKGGSIKITATHNKKHQSSIVFIEFDTSQKDLLIMLLQKYVTEKCMIGGINMNTGIYNYIIGENGIMVICPENKITQNISILYGYLLKAEVSKMQQKYIDGNYGKLVSDIKSFKVTITGKCKGFIKALHDGAGKLDRLVAFINNAIAKKREAFTKTDEVKILIPFDGGDISQLYLSVIMGNIPFSFSGKNIRFYFVEDIENAKKIFKFKNSFQGRIKTFLSQSGSPGSPSKNDKGGVKYKAKIENILDCQNKLASILSSIRGGKSVKLELADIKKVDSDAMSIVKSVKYK
jgi:hypothetical protein